MPKLLNLSCMVIGWASFILNMAANCSNSWWVTLHPQEFDRVGLWEICFNNYRHRFDYYGKVYTGCWWLFSPEIYMLRSWLSTPWYRCVQAFSTLSMCTMVLAVILLCILVFSAISKVSARFVLITAFTNLAAGFFMAIAVITFGVRGKDRNWMPRWQQNWFGWSFHVAICACLLQFLIGGILLFEGTNMKLVQKYINKLYEAKQRRFPSAPK